MAKESRPALPVSGVLGEPRGRLLSELCGKTLTASELAGVVGTSANAVRVHLDGLRSAGLVEYAVQRRGVGKPTHVYSLTSAAEYLLSAAYAPALDVLLVELEHHVNGGLRRVLYDAGARLATTRKTDGGPSTGVGAGLRLLRDLGVAGAVERRGGRQTIRCPCCPLGAVTRRHPALCAFLEGALTSVMGLAATEVCDRAEHPRCGFVLGDEPGGTV